MTKITVFDNVISMKNEEGYPDIDEALIGKLDEMLTAYGIPHSFSLPHPATIEETPNASVSLHYREEDDMVVSLVYALFSKKYRQVENERLGECLIKVGSRFVKKEL